MRYHPLTDADRAHMLQVIGVEAVDDLFADVPRDKLLSDLLNLPPSASEISVERTLARLAGRNRAAGDGPFFIGAGA
jgi:glycine dehydrogenase subunit 1